VHPTINHANTQKGVMHLLRSALRQPRMETSVILQVCTTPMCDTFLFARWQGDPYETPYHILLQCVVISNKFPRLLAEREI